MSKAFRIISFVCAMALIASLAACKNSEDEGKRWAEARYEELMAAPAPTVYASKDPFSLGELIPPTKELPRWQIGYGDFPVMMCSSLFHPIGSKFSNEFLGLEAESAHILPVQHAKKNVVMYNLVHPDGLGTVAYDATLAFYFDESAALELALLADFRQEDREQLESEIGEEIVSVEIAKEAVVFVVSEDNPINALTAEQARGILAGSIANWAELGWDDLAIERYYQTSEDFPDVLKAHVLMGEKLGGTVLETQQQGKFEIDIQPPYEGQIEGIFIAPLRTAREMDGCKILTVDEAAPTEEAIRSGAYPFTFGCYAVYRASNEGGAPGRFAQWILTQEGATLIKAAGYVSVVSTEGEQIDASSEALPRWNGINLGPNLQYAEEFELQGDPGDYLSPAEAAKLTFDSVRDNENIPEYNDEWSYTMVFCDVMEIGDNESYVYYLEVEEPSGTIGAAYAYVYQTGDIYMQGYAGIWVPLEGLSSPSAKAYPRWLDYDTNGMTYASEDGCYWLDGEVRVCADMLPYGDDLVVAVEKYMFLYEPFEQPFSEWIGLEEHVELSAQLGVPVWIAEYTCGTEEDTMLCLDAIVLVDEYNHLFLHTSRDADLDMNSDIDYTQRIMELFYTIEMMPY